MGTTAVTELHLQYADKFAADAVAARNEAKRLREANLSHTPGNKLATPEWHEANAKRHDEIAYNLRNGVPDPYNT